MSQASVFIKQMLRFLLIFFCCWRKNDLVLAESDKPNIILIMADDLGINDVSFRGSNQFLTPNIDALGYHGVIFDRYYSLPLCTPSRATFLTGKYAIHTGMQEYVIPNYEPWGLPLKEKTIGEIFQDAGYSTNLVGKWHLGFYKKVYTPTYRGFDHHFGYLGAYIDYWDYTLRPANNNYSAGYDMRDDLEVHYEDEKIYVTDLFTNQARHIIRHHNKEKPLFLMVNHLAPHAGNEDDPMQAPNDEIERFAHIKDSNRRTYAAMVTKMDKGIGEIIEELQKQNMLHNSIVAFFSDNGAPSVGMHANSGSNFPLKGQKESPWEGALRTPALIWSPLLEHRQKIFTGLFHISDWLPTLAGAAGINLQKYNLALDGLNIWEALVQNRESPRKRVLHNIDDSEGYSSYTNNEWKLVNGTPNRNYDIWLGKLDQTEVEPNSKENYENVILSTKVSRILTEYDTNFVPLGKFAIQDIRRSLKINCGDSQNKSVSENECNPLEKPCLFNINKDPCEYNNLAQKYPAVVENLKRELQVYRLSAIHPVRKLADQKSNPALHNLVWTWWQDENEDLSTTTAASTDLIIAICIFAAILIIALIFIIITVILRRTDFNSKPY